MPGVVGSKRGWSRCGAVAVTLVVGVAAAMPSRAEEPVEAEPTPTTAPSMSATPSESPSVDPSVSPSDEPSPSPDVSASESPTADSTTGSTSEPTPEAPKPTEPTEPHNDESPQTTQEGPLANLDIEASLDKDTYNAGDPVTLSLTLVNTGDTDLGPLRVGDAAWEMDWEPDEPGDSNQLGTDIHLPSGQTYERAFAGRMDLVGDDDELDLELLIGDDEGHSTIVRLSAAVLMTTGDFSGALYADRNFNGVRDPGEALADVKVLMGGGIPFSSRRQWTGVDGTFEFTEIPTGFYDIVFESASGWVVPKREHVRVTVDGDPHVTYRAVRPLTESLDLSMRFAQESYDVDEPADVDVTLINTGPRPLAGVRVESCIDLPSQIKPNDEGWDPVGHDGEGISLAPDETRVVTVTSEVPPSTLRSGVMSVHCEFTADGYVGLGAPDVPSASDDTNVAGLTATIDSRFLHDDGDPEAWEGEPIPDVQIDVMRDGEVVASGVSDRDGRFMVTVPTNVYTLRVRDGWLFTVTGEPTFGVVVSLDWPGAHVYELVGGPADDPGDDDSGGDTSGGTESGVDDGTANGAGDGTLPDTGTPTTAVLLLGCVVLGLGVLGVASGRRARAVHQ